MLKGKTVLVTGAAKGIGKAIATSFAKEGCNIILNYRSTISDDFIVEIKNYGVECLPIQGDVSDFDKSKEIIEKSIETFGSIDILVNNAGVTRDGLLMRMSEQDFDTVLNTNLKGSFNMTRHVINYMIKKRSGTIINISSIVGVIGNVGQVNYAASKAGIIGMTKSIAREVASRGITCNAIAPGFIQTDMTAVLKEDIIKQMTAQIPMKKLGQVEDIAQTAVFLAKSQYITGQVIHVNGGMAM
ncbi:3-oxoacyl-[acyl-carrier-protein] reductase [Clostridium sp. MD294]|uniref:3-oxoacyl-[acyl-carrier-protein] reductase n=1 Tax=Clostridium sp. MD294 TaxID=97138 RepID=UPI0002CCBA4F|nr:3-oxoacyl-[acyl-carrier-protein] reductase [Clostridium sp. MD294]NDO45699.1 3-oxoacyl-[acyl-carrier-protein] reductase [Clostridium sp. MD294]USF30648.1 3-oxoacyl-[acyl-carrier-protein] reductase FabG [Clostridium sp. MD294]